MQPDTSPKTNGLAIASLILSLFSIIIGPFGFVPGIICGHIARAHNRKANSVSGDGMALAGIIVGYVFLVLFAAMLAFYFSFGVASQPSHFENQ